MLVLFSPFIDSGHGAAVDCTWPRQPSGYRFDLITRSEDALGTICYIQRYIGRDATALKRPHLSRRQQNAVSAPSDPSTES